MNPGLIDVEALVRDAQELKPLPASTTRLATLVAADEAELAEIAETVRLDEALMGRLLGAANSAASGARAPITSVEGAVMRLGPGRVLALALGSAVGTEMRQALPAYGLSEGELWNHSVTSALATERARPYCRRPIRAEAYAAALLHDLGKLVLARHLEADRIAAIQRVREEQGLGLDDAERAILSIGHAELGAAVARAWKLPELICEAIEHHHTPLAAPNEASRVLCSQILLADSVATSIGATCGGTRNTCFSPDLAGSLGITTAGFDALCRDVEARVQDVLDLYESL